MPSEKPRTRYREVDEDEESNPLADSANDDYRSASAELYSLNRQLKRTILYLKIALGFFTAIFSFWLICEASTAYKNYQVAGRPVLKTPVPNIPNKKIMFTENKMYSNKPDNVTDALWDALLPNGRGFVYIQDWENYDLPEGQTTPWGMIYSVAMFHQIHCLAELRKFSWMFLNAIVDGNDQEQMKIKMMYEKGVHLEHMNHCFDYLRQSIFCSGDMSMEWPRTELDGERIAVDGWDIPHTCKDINAIMEYMDENHFNMSMNDAIAPSVEGIHRRNLGSSIADWN